MYVQFSKTGIYWNMAVIISDKWADTQGQWRQGKICQTSIEKSGQSGTQALTELGNVKEPLERGLCKYFKNRYLSLALIEPRS